MKKKNAGAGEMPETNFASGKAADEPAPDSEANFANSGGIENSNPAQSQEGESSGFAAKQPEFRIVQPEYNLEAQKTIFKDVGAMWKGVSQKTGKEFFTLKIGKLRLLVFPNQKFQP